MVVVTNVKFIIFTYTCLFTCFVTQFSIKRKKVPAYHTTLLPHHAQLNHWQIMLSFLFNNSHLHPVNHRYAQRIVRATGPQSMNVGGMVPKLRTISVTQGQ